MRMCHLRHLLQTQNISEPISHLSSEQNQFCIVFLVISKQVSEYVKYHKLKMLIFR